MLRSGTRLTGSFAVFLSTYAAAYIFAIAVYLSVGVPSSRTVAAPIAGVDTREDQIEALRILSAGNTIIMVLLGAVLALQVSLSVLSGICA